MICHKCGFEHNSDKECPKCGATVIKVNEEYLKRKKAYEESGKITFAGIDVDTLDKMSNTKVEINIEENVEKELSPKEAMAIAYDKMKNKGQSVIKNSKKRTNKNDKSSKEKKQKRSVDYSLWIKLAAIAIAVILFIAVIVFAVNRIFFKKNTDILWLNNNSLYLSGEDKAVFDNVSEIIENQAKDKMIVVSDKTYMYEEEKTNTISEKPIKDIYYNQEMSLLIYTFEGDDSVYMYGKDKKELKLDINLKITDCYVSKAGKFAALVAYNAATAEYTLYKIDSVGHVTSLETNENEKDVSIITDEGTIILMDYTYSGINSVVTSQMHIYRANFSKLVVEEVTEFIVYEEYVIFVDGKSQMKLMSYEISAPNTLVFENVEEIYTATDNNCKYTNYGSNICYEGENDKIIVLSGGRLYLYDLKKQVTTYLADCALSSVEIYYFENSKYFYYKTVTGLNKVEIKTSEVTYVDLLLPSDKILVIEDKDTIVYRDYYGKLVEMKDGKATKIDEGVKEGSIKQSLDGLAYSYIKDVTVYAKQVGKGEAIAIYSGVESISDLTNIVFNNKKYYFRDVNGKLYQSKVNGKDKKIIGECSQLYIIYKKGI